MGLGQQPSEAVGPGSNLCRVRYFCNFTGIYDFNKQNRDTSSLLPLNFFDTRKFWETGGFPSQVFRFGPVRQSFFWQYRDAPPPPTPLCIKFFDSRNFLKHWRVFPRNSFGTVRQKLFDGKLWYPPPPLSLIHKIFSTPENFWNTEGTPYEVFRSCETKNFQQSHGAPSYTWKFSIVEFFWNTEGLPDEVFRYCETESCRQKIVTYPSYA